MKKVIFVHKNFQITQKAYHPKIFVDRFRIKRDKKNYWFQFGKKFDLDRINIIDPGSTYSCIFICPITHNVEMLNRRICIKSQSPINSDWMNIAPNSSIKIHCNFCMQEIGIMYLLHTLYKHHIEIRKEALVEVDTLKLQGFDK